MKTTYKITWLVVTLITSSLTSFSQIFEQLYDGDSTVDIGDDVFIRPDGSYLIIGQAEKTDSQYLQLMTMTVSADGSHKTSTHLFNFGPANCYPGHNPGTAKALADGGYISPFIIQLFIPPYTTRSQCGLAKFNADGDTVFVKTYTDTSVYFSNAFDCIVMPDGGYLLAATHQLANAGTNTFPALLVRTDSNGNVLWQHTYQKIPGVGTVINRLDLLDNNRILIGAELLYDINIQNGTLHQCKSWFLVLDTSGNILRDTLYDVYYLNGGYFVGGSILKDRNGGYITGGCLNYAPNPDVSSVEDFPSFIAHLDTNFNITWIDTLYYSAYYGQRDLGDVIQLRDGSYAIAGYVYTETNPNPSGWTGKVSKDGITLWNQYHAGDSTGDDDFYAVTERADGGLVFCGEAWNDTLPVWHIHQDIWLISVDSNGCLQPGCDPDTSGGSLQVPFIPAITTDFSVYPNPATNTLTIRASADGSFYLYNILGQQAGAYTVTGGQATISIPAVFAPGVYIGRYKPANGQAPGDVRIVLER